MVPGRHGKRIRAGAWSRGGRLALAGEDNKITISDAQGKLIAQRGGAAAPPSSRAASPWLTARILSAPACQRKHRAVAKRTTTSLTPLLIAGLRGVPDDMAFSDCDLGEGFDNAVSVILGQRSLFVMKARSAHSARSCARSNRVLCSFSPPPRMLSVCPSRSALQTSETGPDVGEPPLDLNFEDSYGKWRKQVQLTALLLCFAQKSLKFWFAPLSAVRPPPQGASSSTGGAAVPT